MRRLLFVLLIAIAILASLPRPTYAQAATHVVREGETLTSIASRYKTTVETLIALNNLKDGDALYIGQVLKLPGSGAGLTSAAQPQTPSAPGTYTVQRGDTLTSIANQYGISVDQLMIANKLTDPSLVRIGQILKIPGETAVMSDSAVAALPTFPDGEQTLSAAGGPAVTFQIANGRLVGITLQTTSSGKQGFPLSCEAKIAQQLAMMYGLNFDETGFLNNLPHSINPKRGFVGSTNGRFYWPRDLIGGSITGPGGYGVHVEGWSPVFQALSGFQVRLLSANPVAAQSQIDAALRHGYPVAVWAILGFRENIAHNSVWIGTSADGTVIDCGGPAPNCYYLASGEHAYLILGKRDDSYLLFNPGDGEISYFSRATVITGITTLFAVPTGSAPGAVIVPTADRIPDLSRLPNW
ncbi:MAG: LysM peptidoglycan-binding domain-containing protein [Chloroflexota bacterium]